MTTPTSSPAAGWYPDTSPGRLRWFDGASWTEHTTPVPATAQVPLAATVVAHPGRRPASGPGGSPSDPLHWLLPPGRSGVSILAGYVALVAAFVWVLGPVSLVLGVLAVRAGGRGGNGLGRAWFAVVVGAAASLGALVLGLGMLT